MRTPQTSPLRSPCQRCFPAQRRSRSGAGRFGSRRDAPNAEAKSAKETLHTTPGYTPWTTHSSCTGHKIQRISEVSGRDQDGRVWTYGLGSGGGGRLGALHAPLPERFVSECIRIGPQLPTQTLQWGANPRLFWCVSKAWATSIRRTLFSSFMFHSFPRH